MELLINRYCCILLCWCDVCYTQCPVLKLVMTMLWSYHTDAPLAYFPHQTLSLSYLYSWQQTGLFLMTAVLGQSSSTDPRLSYCFQCLTVVIDRFLYHFDVYCKGKAIPLLAWTGPEGSRRLRLPDFMNSAHEVGKVASPTYWPPLPPRKYSRYSFLLEAESTLGP